MVGTGIKYGNKLSCHLFLLGWSKIVSSAVSRQNVRGVKSVIAELEPPSLTGSATENRHAPDPYRKDFPLPCKPNITKFGNGHENTKYAQREQDSFV